jgi:hypothetical protein
MFDTQPIYPPGTPEYNDVVVLPPDGHKNFVVMHISTALQIEYGKFDDDKIWLPDGFRETIFEQWREVSTMINNIVKNNNSDPTKEKVGILHSKLLISVPGVNILPHVHQCKQAVAICYKYDDCKIESDEKSHFKMGGSYRIEELNRPHNWKKKIYFPDVDKFYFSFRNDPVHEVQSNEWRFWWFTDFSTYVDIPNLPFYYWDDPYLDNDNLK